MRTISVRNKYYAKELTNGCRIWSSNTGVSLSYCIFDTLDGLTYFIKNNQWCVSIETYESTIVMLADVFPTKFHDGTKGYMFVTKDNSHVAYVKPELLIEDFHMYEW